jgi:phosphohistidine phosphatase
MKLYLVQHGDALPKDVAPDRPLSDKGRQEVGSVALFLKASQYPVNKVLHSGKTRALQTAQIFSDALTAYGGVETINDIAPNDSVESFAKRLANFSDLTMVVGHQPFMGKLTSLLLGNINHSDGISFQPGSVVCLQGDNEGLWSLQWMVRPELCVGTV